jgi:hypothetical protein
VVCDYRSIRGATIVACVADECAFWQVDGINPDREVLVAVRGGMASVKGAVLLIVSSPFAKRGVLWDIHRRHWGVENSRVLVWKAPTRVMNPTIDQRTIDEAMEDDPASARAEYLAEFRDDIASFVDREVVEAAVIAGRQEIPPGAGGLINLSAHVDASGGSGADSYAVAIAGKDRESGKAVLVCVREVKPPFSPEDVTKEYAELLKTYGLFEATADKFAGSWPKEQFEKRGVTLVGSKTSSELFLELLPLLNSRRAELLDDKRVVAQLCGLERKTGRGRDYISAGGSGHDDLAVVVAGSLVRASREDAGFTPVMPIILEGGPSPGDEWSPNWAGSTSLLDASDGLPRDYFIGTSRWLRERQGGK